MMTPDNMTLIMIETTKPAIMNTNNMINGIAKYMPYQSTLANIADV